jgi:hypothetical protein
MSELKVNKVTPRSGTTVTIGDSGEHLALAGNIGIGGATPTTSGTGITFPATQVASANANTLDDYEEGTWTPTYVASTTDFTSITYQAQNGTYTKIGRLVIVNVGMSTNGITAGAVSRRSLHRWSSIYALFKMVQMEQYFMEQPIGQEIMLMVGLLLVILEVIFVIEHGTTFSSINPADLGTGGSANNYFSYICNLLLL